MGFFEHTRIDGADTAELSAVTYTTVVLDTGASVTVNGVPLTNGAAPQAFNMRVRTINSPSGNVYLLGTPNEADQTPVVPPAPFDIYSFRFNGTAAPNAIIVTGDEGIFDISTNITISTWVKPVSVNPAQDGGVVDKNLGSGGGTTGWGLTQENVSGGVWRFRIGAGGTASGNKTLDVNVVGAGTWQHLCATFDSATGDMLLYVDSVLQGTLSLGAGATILTNNTNLLIGNQTGTLGSPGIKEFDGNLDEISIFDVTFNQTEIDEIYNAGTPTDLSTHSRSADGVGWYRCGENSTWNGADWEMPNSFNPGTGDSTSAGLVEGDRVADTP